MRHISNSEVGSWLTCRNMYRYGYDLKLAPINQSVPLDKGTLGHEVLEAYYKSLQEHKDFGAAKVAGVQVLGKHMGSGLYPMDIILEVRRIVESYWAFYGPDEDWELLQIEESMDLPLTEDYTMPGRLDLLVRDKEGKIALVDHKFFYDMPSQTKLSLNVQFPKYIGALANAGIRVDYCVLNVLRTRVIKDPSKKVFERYKVTVSSAKIRRALQTHILASEEISKYRELPEAVRPTVAIPIFNDMVCKMCSFSDLCASEFDGGDITYLIKNQYKENTYGYNSAEEGEL